MTVQAIGPQKATLSPPRKNCGSNSVTKVKKLKLKPMANGIRPKTVVIAVSSTGLRRVAPPCTMASLM